MIVSDSRTQRESEIGTLGVIFKGFTAPLSPSTLLANGKNQEFGHHGF